MAFPEIQFGTDGWRAILGEGFTTDRFLAVMDALAATADMQAALKRKQAVLIAYDARFQADAFAALAATRLTEKGFKCILADGATGTPGICAAIVDRKAALGIMITASHNPPEYLGVKIKGAYGGSATPKLIAGLVSQLQRQKRLPQDKVVKLPARQPDGMALADFNAEHIAKLLRFITPRKGKTTIVHDAMFGSGKALLAKALAGSGAKVVAVRHADNPGFGGIGPEPVPERMQPMFQAVRRHHAMMGIATDGDADRVAACDAAGRFVFPHEIFALMTVYLHDAGKRGKVVRNFATSELVCKIAEDRGLKVKTTPVGFKHIVEEMLRGGVLIGGEESGGIAVPEFLPERDGIMCGLMLREIVLQQKKPLRGLLDDLYKKYGASTYRRWDLHIPEAKKQKILTLLEKRPPEAFGRDRVTGIDRLDGCKFLLPGRHWLLVRASGTEPILRVYIEGKDERHVKTLYEAFAAWVKSGA